MHNKKSFQVLSLVYICLLTLFVVVTYYPSLYSPFVFDDLPNIVTNSYVHPATFADILNAINSNASSSRPLAMISIAFSFWTGKLDVFDYHVFNLIVHLGNAVLLYFCIVTLCLIPNSRIGNSLSEKEILNLAFWSAILWALNPVQHQAVTYIVQRMTSLATLFYLLSILCFLKYQARQLSLAILSILLSIFFVMGMACKEIVITMPVSLVLIDFFLLKNDRKVNLKWVLTAVAIAIGISFIYVNGKLPDFFEKFPNREFSPYERILTELRVIWHYLSLLIFPYPDRLHLDYNFDISTSLVQPITTLYSLLTLIVTFITGWLLRKRLPVFSFALAFFFLAASVEASFLNLELAFLHRLYLPSLFIFFGLMTCIPPQVRKRITIVLLILLTLFSYGTLVRNYDWRTRANLWEIDYSREASPERSIANKGISSLELGRYDDTIELVGAVLDKLKGDDEFTALYALAMAHYHKKDYDNALSYFKRLQNRKKIFAQLSFYQGMVYLKLNRDVQLDKIIEQLRRAFPDMPYSGILTAEKLRRDGDHETAILTLENLIDNINKGYVNELILIKAYLADMFLEIEKFDKAYKLYQEIVTDNPDAYFAWKQIYSMQLAAGDLENATIIKTMLEAKGVIISE